MTLSTITVSHHINYHTTLTLSLCFQVMSRYLHSQLSHPDTIYTWTGYNLLFSEQPRETVSKTMSHPPPHPGDCVKDKIKHCHYWGTNPKPDAMSHHSHRHWWSLKRDRKQLPAGDNQQTTKAIVTVSDRAWNSDRGNLTPDQSLSCSQCLYNASRKLGPWLHCGYQHIHQ